MYLQMHNTRHMYNYNIMYTVTFSHLRTDTQDTAYVPLYHMYTITSSPVPVDNTDHMYTHNNFLSVTPPPTHTHTNPHTLNHM